METKIPTIDIVVPWVNGQDPAWKKVRMQYSGDSSCDTSDARYRDWDLFRYWFRGVEEYAPWVRQVHLLTWGHLPQWLNTEHPKLHIVRHEEFIPQEYLPTFSSHVIELNMHRIPDLAEHFIYFNDDVYLTQPVQSEDFFRDGVPVDTAVFGVIKNTDSSNFMPYIMLNMMGLINMTFPKRQVMKRDFRKWYTLRNGKGVLNNIYLSPWSTFTGFRNFHTCVAYQKTTFTQVWDKFTEALSETCSHKFRSRQDVNQYLFRYWQLVTGNFVPHKPNSTYLTIGIDSNEEVASAMLGTGYKVVCVNDDPMGFDFDEEQKKIQAIFEKKYPKRSSFEIEG